MCYVIPAILSTGIVIVISPLIALMEDQVTQMKRRKIPTEFLAAKQPQSTKAKVCFICIAISAQSGCPLERSLIAEHISANPVLRALCKGGMQDPHSLGLNRHQVVASGLPSHHFPRSCLIFLPFPSLRSPSSVRGRFLPTWSLASLA